MISKKEVEHIAKLARLGLAEKKIEKFQKDLSSILDYMEKLKKAESKNEYIQASSALIENTSKEDKVKVSSSGTVNMIVESFPEKKEGYAKVKTVLDRET